MTQLIGKFVWFENVTPDIPRAKAFYSEVFGWRVEEYRLGNDSYDMITVAGAPIGGFCPAEAGARSHWTSYASVADVDATTRRIVSAGGTVAQQPFDVPEVGRMARVVDPQGASFWVMRGKGDDAADDATPVPGKFHWNELWARDAKAAVVFYEKALGYQHKEMAMPDGAYHLLEQGGVPRGGVLDAPAEIPPMWLPYVTVADCDATLARSERFRARVHMPPTDVPGVGRFAIFVDPLGATLAIIQPAPR